MMGCFHYLLYNFIPHISVMNSNNRSNHRIAVIVAVVLSVLLNFYQTFYVLGIGWFSRGPGGGPRVDMMENPRLDLFFHVFFTFLIAYLLFLLNFSLLRSSSKKNLMFRIFVTIFSFAVFTVVFSQLHLFFLNLDMDRYWGPFIFGAYMGRSVLITLVVLFSTQILFLTNQRQESLLEIQRLAAENLRSRYNALRTQVNPHFLFNSLNTLNSLIGRDVKKSQDYVQQLSTVLRHSLQKKEMTTLEEELRFTESFCYLMKIRYGDSLHFEFDVDPKYLNAPILPLSLQILIENAIKHNAITSRQPLCVTLHTWQEGFLTVSNPIQLKKEKEEGEGIGLVNLVERYRLMMHQSIEIFSMEGVFMVKIPLPALLLQGGDSLQ